MFYNATETIGIILNQGTNATTGSLFVTLLFIFIVLLAICLMFGIPTEFSAVLLFPLTLSMAAYYQNFIIVLGILSIYFAFILTKNFLFR